MLERSRPDKWYRLTLQSQVINEEQVKAWNRLAEGPIRAHVATAAEREQAPWPSPSIPICRKQKDGTNNMFVYKEEILSTQPKSSNIWLWQDWRSWQGGKNSSSYIIFQALRSEDPHTPRSRTWNATRLRDTESVMFNEPFTI